VSKENVIGILRAGALNFLHAVNGNANTKIGRQPNLQLGNLQTCGSQVNSMSACRQRYVSPAIHEDSALCAASHLYDAAGQFEQLAFGQVLFTYLYEVYAPVKGLPDAADQGCA